MSKRPVPPPPTKFGPAAAQPARSPATAGHRMPLPVPPPAWRKPAYGPAQAKRGPYPAGVIQRASTMDTTEDGYPKKPPAGRDKAYYEDGMTYHMGEGDFDAYDVWVAMAEAETGKIGQSAGSGESADFDASYIDIPAEGRPSAPLAATLWKTVYVGLAPKPSDASVLRVRCEELCTAFVEVSKTTKIEATKSRRPPMCHKLAFNHIKWAVAWLAANRTLAAAQKYAGPAVDGMDLGTWKDLVWHAANLRPGHADCNSKTAKDAVGAPASDAAEKVAIAYTVTRLKALRPGWFS